MLTLYLVRHTTPDIEPGTCYGRSDLDVAESFDKEALSVYKSLQKGLKDQKSTRIISSSALRCKKLAYYLQDKFELTDIEFSSDILELDFGDWEQKPWHEIETKDAKNFGNWCSNFNLIAPPGGESYQGLNKRTEKFLENLKLKEKNTIETKEDKVILIVTHSSIIRSLLRKILNLAPFNTMSLDIDFASITKIYFDKKLERVGYVNRG